MLGRSFDYEREMAKATREHEAEEAEKARLARLREERKRIREWYVLIFILFATAAVIACHERVAVLVTTTWAAVVPAGGGGAGTGGKGRRAVVPGMAALDKAKQTIGDAKSVNQRREKLLDELDPQGSGPAPQR